MKYKAPELSALLHTGPVVTSDDPEKQPNVEYIGIIQPRGDQNIT